MGSLASFLCVCVIYIYVCVWTFLVILFDDAKKKEERGDERGFDVQPTPAVTDTTAKQITLSLLPIHTKK
jgi:hypothetical protein